VTLASGQLRLEAENPESPLYCRKASHLLGFGCMSRKNEARLTGLVPCKAACVGFGVIDVKAAFRDGLSRYWAWRSTLTRAKPHPYGSASPADHAVTAMARRLSACTGARNQKSSRALPFAPPRGPDNSPEAADRACTRGRSGSKRRSSGHQEKSQRSLTYSTT